MELGDKFSDILDSCENLVKSELQISTINEIIKKVENLNISSVEVKHCKNYVPKISFQEFVKKFEEFQDASFEQCRCWPVLGILYVLHCVSTHYQTIPVDDNEDKQNAHQQKETVSETNSKYPRNYPMPPNDLISLQNLKRIETLVNFVLYSIYFSCLDDEAAVYLKMKPCKENYIRERTVWQQQNHRFSKTLLIVLQTLIPLFMHQWIGAHLQRKFFTELFCGLLQLGFAPKKDLHDMHYSREKLNYFMENKPLLVLKSVLFLKGIISYQGGKGYVQAVCQSLYLRRFLLNSNDGLRSIISLSSSNDLKRKEAIASLIALAKVPDEQVFYQILGPQMLQLIRETENNVDVFHTLSLILCQLSERNPSLVQSHILEILLFPLITLTHQNPDKNLCDSLPSVIITLHKMLLDMLPPDAELLLHLEMVLCPIFEISTLPPTCHVKSKAHRMIERYLNKLNKEEIVTALLTIIGIQTNDKIPQVNPNIKLIAGMNSISIETRSIKQDWNEMDEKKITFLIEVFEKLKHSDYIIDFFEKLTTFIDFTIFNKIENVNNTLLVDEDINEIKFERIRRLSLVVGIISSASENDKLTSKIFNDVNSALNIIKILLEIHHQQCLDAELAQIKDSCVMSCVMLLSGFITTSQESGKITHKNWNALNDIVPSLKGIVDSSTNAALIMFAKQLINIITTHGAICSPHDNDSKIRSELSKDVESKSSSTSNNNKKPVGNTSSSSTFKSSFATTTTTTTKTVNSLDGSASTFREALIDVCSPHIAIRGHALILLSKLLLAGDQETLSNMDKVMSLFEYHLRDDDTYIYLAAIKGCSTLASKYPDKVIGILTEEFTFGKHTTETRLKLIEILTETARNLGPLLLNYKNLFLNSVLSGAKDEDSYVRASCLSNLGEICKVLHFSIESVIYEIFSLVECVIKNEKCAEVKRAAVLLITMLLQGLGPNSLKVLQSLMLNIYRGLKHLILTDNDPILVTHAQLAMEEINSVTREFLRPKTNLSKKIYVTELPPNLF